MGRYLPCCKKPLSNTSENDLMSAPLPAFVDCLPLSHLATLRPMLPRDVASNNMKLDSAVIKTLALDPSNVSVSSIGGGDSSASAFKIAAKTEHGRESPASCCSWLEATCADDSLRSKKLLHEDRLRQGRRNHVQRCVDATRGHEFDSANVRANPQGEYASLNAIHNAVHNLCPAAFGEGRLAESPSKSYLVTDFLDMSSRRTGGSSSSPSLAAKMAKLHTTPAPVPEGYDKPVFGFPVTTCCGDTAQPNDYTHKWADFYAEHRLRFILRKSERSNGKDQELHRLVIITADKVVPRLIGDDRLNGGKGITPVVIHGDLWAGNAARGSIGDEEGAQDIIFDPSAVYGHNEYELGIMNMFGGFGPAFFKEYHQLCPKTEPQNEYDDRVSLYEL